MAWIGAVVGVVGSLMSAKDDEEGGKLARREKIYEAVQLEQQAGQVKAAAQREMLDTRHSTELLASRAQAVAAASGGGASDPTVQKIIADINGEGAYREAVSVYQGEDQARRLKESGRLARYEGDQAQKAGSARATASEFQALSYAAKGAGGMYTRYGMSQPTLATGTGID